jgi:ribA/ribD-fused uncharacterized protein
MITEFQGQYRFLSNFYYVQHGITYESMMFFSVEHAYQAAKSLDLNDREYIRKLNKPGEAKRYGKTVSLREDWQRIKIDIMFDLVRQKFKLSPYKIWLLETKDEVLIEGNTWKDTFWGVCKGIGENHLGKILMQIRNELQSGGY